MCYDDVTLAQDTYPIFPIWSKVRGKDVHGRTIWNNSTICKEWKGWINCRVKEWETDRSHWCISWWQHVRQVWKILAIGKIFNWILILISARRSFRLSLVRFRLSLVSISEWTLATLSLLGDTELCKSLQYFASS